MNNKRNLLLVGVLAVMFLLVIGLAQAKDRTAYLGVFAQSVDKDIAEAFKLGADYGAVVNDVVDESPADEAGLRDGDVIIKFDGKKVWDYDDLLDYLEDYNPGDKVTLTITRDEDQMDIPITLGDQKDKPESNDFFHWNSTHPGRRAYVSPPTVPNVPNAPNAPNAPNVYVFSNRNYIGVSLNDLNDQLGNYFGVDDGDGALITEVTEDSPAEKAGLKAGDVIVGADGDKIGGYADIKKMVNKKEPGEIIALNIIRDKKEMNIDVEVEKQEGSSYGYQYNYSGPNIDLSQLDVQIPKLKGFMHSLYNDQLNEYFNSEEFKKEMQEFSREMEQLKKELKETKRYEKDEVRTELEQLKKELNELRKKVDD